MRRPVLSATLSAILLSSTMTAPALASDSAELITESERSGFVRTGRYDEVIALCDAFARRYPGAVRCFDFGTTPEGRPMKALAVSRTGRLTAEEVRAAALPVLLVQGGIHAGEIDGKDAGFLLLRQLLEGKAGKGVLDRLVLVFVPVFNVDGHERFAAWNRPNQRGPEEMGWRTTAQNYNLNRDYMKADAPEMQAMLALVNEWDPLAMMDLHVTDGAKFRHDISIMVEPTLSADETLRKAGTSWRDGVIAQLARQGSLPLSFYPSFIETDNPVSGFEHGVAPPRFSQGYFSLRNRLGMLVETHSWKDYPTRVRITRNTVLAAAELIARHGRQWQQEVAAADARAAALGGQPVALEYKATAAIRTIPFKGYAYTRTPSDISGALMTRYDENKPEIWNIPLHDEVLPSRVVNAPRAGYLVPAARAATIAAKLRQHGIEFRRLEHARRQWPVQAYRAEKSSFSATSFEGRQPLTTTGAWTAGQRDLGAGALFVPVAQAKARLVVAMFEPQAPDSLLSWGSFNTAFERKEYMEDYVAEEVARKMLAEDAGLKARFEQKLKDDAAFANDPGARLEFFARLHPSWDTSYNVYPVLRTDTQP